MSNAVKNNMHSTGIEPVSTPWKGAILPLNYECCCEELLHTLAVDVFFGF